MVLEYWWCKIGPIDREKVPFGGDFPLRQAVKQAFSDTIGEHAVTCSSGWGMDEEEAQAIEQVQNAAFHRRHATKPGVLDSIKTEKYDLDIKGRRLSYFIGLDPEFNSLDPELQKLLKEQCETMWQYSEILNSILTHLT